MIAVNSTLPSRDRKGAATAWQGGSLTVAARKIRPGFSLLEMAVVIVVLTLLMSMIVLSINSVIRIERSDAAFHQQTVDHANTGDQFRGDVARAFSAPKEWLHYKADKHCLILEHDRDTHIVYQWTEKKLQRLHIQAGITISKLMPVGGDTVEFTRPDPHLCQLRFTAESGPTSRFPTEITAALGGERR